MTVMPDEEWLSEARERFLEGGFVVTPSLFDAATLGAVGREIERTWTARRERDDARPDVTKRLFTRVRPELQRLHLESDALASFCRHPALVALAGALLGPDVDLSWNQGYTKAPGGDAHTAIPWHQDGHYAEIRGAMFNCWVAITEATVENGALWRSGGARPVLPHTWDLATLFFKCEIDEREAVPVELAPGQAFVFGPSVVHRSGPNLTGATRVGYSISFAVADARLAANGEAFGNRVPVLRGGRRVDELMERLATGVSPPDERVRAESVLVEIEARMSNRAPEVRALFAGYGEALSNGERDAAAARLGRMLALLPGDEEVSGDLLSARTRVDQLLEEASSLRGQDSHGARRLLERALQLDPTNEAVRASLRRLR
jgi:ectoine hydroxylase-related dioxygenase (phytanoyl-CoA dioxygenase family)